MNALMKKLRAAVSRTSWNALRQRGSILVLTAFALPVILAGIGFAVDAGNIYVHKAQLQNAADAAALGGAHDGMEKNGNSIQTFVKNLSAANETASNLIDENVNADAEHAVSPTFHCLKSKGNPNSVCYYKVDLKQQVPLLFLKYFLPQDMTTVKASSYAKIVQTGGGKPPFTDLLIYSKEMWLTNSIDHPDNFKLKNSIKTAVDGRVRATNAEALSKTQYSTQTQNLKAFFTKEAKDNPDMTVQKALDHPMTYDEKTGAAVSKGYSSTAVQQDYNMNAYWNDTIASIANRKLQEYGNQRGNLKSDITSSDLVKDDVIVYDLNVTDHYRNLSVNINQPLAKPTDSNANDPVYVIVKGGTNTLSIMQVNVSANSVRPVIVCVEPAAGNKDGKIHFKVEQGTKATFRGILYAPNMEGQLLTNINEGTFLGSIIAPKLELQGGAGYYIYDGITDSSSGTSGGGKPDIGLSAEDDNDIGGEF